MRQHIRLSGEMIVAVSKQGLRSSESRKSSGSELLARKMFRNGQNDGFRKQLFGDSSLIRG
jgi:hypothetical protein